MAHTVAKPTVKKRNNSSYNAAFNYDFQFGSEFRSSPLAADATVRFREVGEEALEYHTYAKLMLLMENS